MLSIGTDTGTRAEELGPESHVKRAEVFPSPESTPDKS